jgi:hypothetical protein
MNWHSNGYVAFVHKLYGAPVIPKIVHWTFTADVVESNDDYELSIHIGNGMGPGIVAKGKVDTTPKQFLEALHTFTS